MCIFFINSYHDSSRPALVMRDAIDSCTGDGGIRNEDDRDYCAGWVPIEQGAANQNCTRANEFT